MRSSRPVRVGAIGRIAAPMFVLCALIGTWLGHSLEYLRINGPGALAWEMGRSVHLYMLPLGAVLLAAALVGGARWVRGVNVLAARLAQLREAVRGGRWPSPGLAGSTRFLRRSTPTTSTIPAQFASLWVLLALIQVGLYLLQENLEARLVGLRGPGLTALSGQHWAAVPIHLAVAAVLAMVMTGLLSRRARLERTVEDHERLLARLWAGRVRRVGRTRRLGFSLTPHQRWGAQRWERPPPSFAAA